MKFKLKSARYHPLQGLEVTGEDGEAYLTETKRSVLDAGAVMFLQNYPTPCPHKVKFNFKGQEDMPDHEYEMDGTDDPATLALARKLWGGGVLPFHPDWQNVPLE